MTQRSAERTENGDYILETAGLTKKFGGLVAVDDVDYQLPYGELSCIIGPNGAGKSTFFELLVGLQNPTKGEMMYKGESMNELNSYERIRDGISIKLQNPNVYSDLTVRENIRIPIQRTQKTGLGERITEVLSMVDLTEEADSKVATLSHGKQQWLEIGMAISTQPDLLLLDEPTAGMPSNETEDTCELIKSLIGDNMSVIVIEHDIDVVRQIADSVTVFHNGDIFASGTFEEIESNEEVQKIYLGET